jgi:hypothetical protein
MMNTVEKYFDLKTLAEYSCLSVRTLREYLSDTENPIPSFCLKRKILVKRVEFDKWMESHRTDNHKLDRIVNELVNDLQ